MPPKVTLGSEIAVPALPVFWIDSSHREGWLTSPEAGKDCSRCQPSTERKSASAPAPVPVPFHTEVVTSVRRLRVKKVGLTRRGHVLPSAQIWSKGTSGQFFLVVSVRLVQPSV